MIHLAHAACQEDFYFYRLIVYNGENVPAARGCRGDKMTTKEQILAMLERNREIILSGEQIAQSLGVSRAAVWKAVRTLEADGYEIEAAPNRGYRLSPRCDVLSEQGILAHLPEGFSSVRVFPSLDSTNNKAKELAASGCPHGTAVFALTQTGGRGRYGRSFSSPSGGLYMTVVLRVPDVDTATVTAAAAVAVCKAVEEVTGLHPQIKWVNDVLLDGKKICGILSEAVTDLESGAIEWVVVGIGVNIYWDGFPEELNAIATALYPQNPGGTVRTRLAAGILKNLLPAPLSGEAMRAAYKARLSMLGRTVNVHAPDGVYEAVAEDIDAQCRLLVRLSDGSQRVLSSGEVSVKPAR